MSSSPWPNKTNNHIMTLNMAINFLFLESFRWYQTSLKFFLYQSSAVLSQTPLSRAGHSSRVALSTVKKQKPKRSKVSPPPPSPSGQYLKRLLIFFLAFFWSFESLFRWPTSSSRFGHRAWQSRLISDNFGQSTSRSKVLLDSFSSSFSSFEPQVAALAPRNSLN